MRSLDIFRAQVQILHRGGHVAMPEDDRQPHHFSAVAEVLGREGVPQSMEATSRQPKAIGEAVVAP
jgi:hypothetical protein